MAFQKSFNLVIPHLYVLFLCKEPQTQTNSFLRLLLVMVFHHCNKNGMNTDGILWLLHPLELEFMALIYYPTVC